MLSHNYGATFYPTGLSDTSGDKRAFYLYNTAVSYDSQPQQRRNIFEAHVDLNDTYHMIHK